MEIRPGRPAEPAGDWQYDACLVDDRNQDVLGLGHELLDMIRVVPCRRIAGVKEEREPLACRVHQIDVAGRPRPIRDRIHRHPAASSPARTWRPASSLPSRQWSVTSTPGGPGSSPCRRLMTRSPRPRPAGRHSPEPAVGMRRPAIIVFHDAAPKTTTRGPPDRCEPARRITSAPRGRCRRGPGARLPGSARSARPDPPDTRTTAGTRSGGPRGSVPATVYEHDLAGGSSATPRATTASTCCRSGIRRIRPC